MPYFSYLCRNKRLCAFQKVRQTNLQPKCSKRGGWGRGHVFFNNVKKSRIGWGWHPSLTWLGPNSNRILQITSPRCRGGGRVAGLVPKKRLITPSLIHSLDFFVVCTMTIVDVAHETGTTQHKLGQQYFR